MSCESHKLNAYGLLALDRTKELLNLVFTRVGPIYLNFLGKAVKGQQTNKLDYHCSSLA